MLEMSHYEVYDVIVSLRGEAQTTAGLFLTVVSGYLAIAYVVGSSLTRAQVTTITGIFLVFTFVQVMGHLSTMLELGALSEQIQLGIESPIKMEFWAFAFSAVHLSIIAASLKFMWDVRH